MPNRGTFLQRARVPLGFLFAAVFLLLAQPIAVTLVVGGGVALIGLGLRAWAAGHIRKNDKLAITGPYAYTRNPLYLGSFMLGLGFMVAAGRWWLWILFAGLFLGIYLPVMRVEAATLRGLFGTAFETYEMSVPLFLPRLIPYSGQDQQAEPFDPGLYMRYREYRAALGMVCAWAILLLKAVFF